MAAASHAVEKKSKGKKDRKSKDKTKEKSKDKSKSKGKSKQSGDAANPLQAPDQEVDSAFETLYPVLDLPIPPVWTSNPFGAFSDLMDTLVMRYVPQLSGVLITHNPTQFLQQTARIASDSAFATVPIGFECIVWRPKVGQKLEGTITLSSPSHVSLLLHATFNASIPASHLPADEWEFIVDAETEEGVQEMGADRGLGHWRHKSSGERLGGKSGKLTFTVISMTVANHLLSLHGSLLEDPFSLPAPTQDTTYLTNALLDAKALRPDAVEDESAENEVAADTKVAARKTVRFDSDDGSDDDEVKVAEPVAPPAVEAQESSKGSKRKSRKSSEGDASGDEAANGSSKEREKKKRKKDKEREKSK